MQKKRAVLYIRCSPQEAEEIHNAARRERRTVSAFVLNAVASKLAVQQRIDQAYAKQIARDILKQSTL